MTRASYCVSFYPDMVGAHLHVSRPAESILEYLVQELHKALWGDLLISFLSRILISTVFLAHVQLFLQRNDSAGQPVDGHTDSCQVALF
jgi:hypothetical protein